MAFHGPCIHAFSNSSDF